MIMSLLAWAFIRRRRHRTSHKQGAPSANLQVFESRNAFGDNRTEDANTVGGRLEGD